MKGDVAGSEIDSVHIKRIVDYISMRPLIVGLLSKHVGLAMDIMVSYPMIKRSNLVWTAVKQ